MTQSFKLLLAIQALICISQANFLEVLKPKTYHKSDKLDVHVGQLWSPRFSYPYDFYKLSWCDSSAGHKYDPDTIGVVLRDTKISESPYTLDLGTLKDPGIVCTRRLSMPQLTQFNTFIMSGFRYKLYLDGLPSAVKVRNDDTGEWMTDYDHGIPIGRFDKETKRAIIYNHLEFIIKTHEVDGDPDQRRVVGFEVKPKSIRKGSKIYRGVLDEQPDQYLDPSNGSQDILFSYTTTILVVKSTWSHRLDHYYNHGNSDILMKELSISAVVVIVFGTAAFLFIKRSLSDDFA